ncbi:sensor histidine kinase [Microbacterium telephonicum]|uniref:GHKL domain-containing protein n=1 Tax=Microbacterium telephonicum TaxID=1714841 RepID=A0A498C6H9_9MICO|nr:ATP-binding protein [Microbacterium telephonicum]RLK48118.1 GHKL domain-containing protein [Microbacterium telephonicum]
MNDVAGPVLAEIPRYLTAIAEWGACVVYIVVARRRFRVPGTVAICLLALVALLGVQWWAGTLPIAWWIPGMLVAAGTMYGFVFAGLDATARGAGFVLARTFVLAELAASGYWQMDRFYSSRTEPVTDLLSAAALYAVVFAVVGYAERRQFRRDERFDVGGAQLVGAMAIAAATFGISNLSFVSADTPFSGRFGSEILYIRTLVDLCGFIALHVQLRIHREAVARRDTEAMAQLLRSQHDQYEITRRTIDEVNRKHHDMKHHLDAIRSEQDASARSRMLDDLEESIRRYGAVVRTGNHVLDAIVTAKLSRAHERDIEVSVVADGALLSFMRPLELTSLVGNALDNAIEGAARVATGKLRMIKFAVFAQDDFVMVRVENTFDGVVLRDGDRIVTRQQGPGHGYGLRNIETAAAAYGGAVSVHSDERWFSLRVLFPVREDARGGVHAGKATLT